MKLLAALGIFACLFVGACAQNGPAFFRIRVYHADPWAVKAMIEGTSINQPEMSTILGFAGIPDKDSSLIEDVFGGKGRLVVDSTDNSLIFIPTKG